MSRAKELLEQATPLPWIRPWGELTVRSAFGTKDVFGHLVPSINHPGSPEAQANIDLAVYAVNRLPDYEAAVEALERLATQGDGDDVRAILRRLRDEVPA